MGVSRLQSNLEKVTTLPLQQKEAILITLVNRLWLQVVQNLRFQLREYHHLIAVLQVKNELHKLSYVMHL